MATRNREKYSGQRVALDGDQVIASGPTPKEVYSKASGEGLQIPFCRTGHRARVSALYQRVAFVSKQCAKLSESVFGNYAKPGC